MNAILFNKKPYGKQTVFNYEIWHILIKQYIKVFK